MRTESITLPRAVMAALPASMRQLAERTGVEGPELWETVRAMRGAGFLRRTAGRNYIAGKKVMPDSWNLSPEAIAAARTKGGKRKRHTVLVSIPNWPPQEPGRTMVFSSFTSQTTAATELQRLMESVPDVDWRVELLSTREQLEIQNRPVQGRSAEGTGNGSEDSGGLDEPTTSGACGDDATTPRRASDQ